MYGAHPLKVFYFLYLGGQGFLGQHIIRLLQQDERVAEIRVLDKEVLTNRIGTIRIYTYIICFQVSFPF